MTELVRRFAQGRSLTLMQGDLTTVPADAIVNAANERLAHGGGVAAAIVRRGGPAIQAESDAWVRKNGLASHERPALTGAGALPCRAIIHAVGPVWRGGDDGEDDKLAAAYAASLELAEEQGFGRVAFPALSTGIFGYPVARAAGIALGAIEEFFTRRATTRVREVVLVLFDAATVAVFEEAFRERWGQGGRG